MGKILLTGERLSPIDLPFLAARASRPRDSRRPPPSFPRKRESRRFHKPAIRNQGMNRERQIPSSHPSTPSFPRRRESRGGRWVCAPSHLSEIKYESRATDPFPPLWGKARMGVTRASSANLGANRRLEVGAARLLARRQAGGGVVVPCGAAPGGGVAAGQPIVGYVHVRQFGQARQLGRDFAGQCVVRQIQPLEFG